MAKTISDYTISELNALYRMKELSPVEVTKYMLDKAKKSQDQINSFVLFTEERALKEAKAAEKKIMSGEGFGPLTGIPYNVKDLIDVKGTPTTLACNAYHDNYKDKDAAVVEKLTAAGAVLLGKSNTMQLAMGTTSDVSSFGPVKNPRNLKHVSGGSSGGSSASVAAGVSCFSIGTDQGGSVRIPSGLTGVVGIKPTLGRMSYYGSATASDMVDHLGVLTRTVEDNATVLSATSGYDPRHKFSLNAPQEDFTKVLGKGVKGMKIAVPTKLVYDLTVPFVADCYTKALNILKEGGAKVKEVEFPDMSEYRKAHQQIFMVGCIYNHRKILAERPEMIEEEMYNRMKVGDIPASEYFKAIKIWDDCNEIFQGLMQGCDFMLTPTTQTLAVKLMEREVKMGDGKVYPIYNGYTQYTWFGNYLGIPGMSIPTGFNKDNLPAGALFIGRQKEEANLYRAASYLESVLGPAPLAKLAGLDY